MNSCFPVWKAAVLMLLSCNTTVNDVPYSCSIKMKKEGKRTTHHHATRGPPPFFPIEKRDDKLRG